MDIVITYVNGLDPEWQKDYEKTFNKPILAKRFRELLGSGTLFGYQVIPEAVYNFGYKYNR